MLSGVFTLAAMLALAPLGAFLPRAALSGVLIVVGFAMINRRQMLRVWHSSRGEAAIFMCQGCQGHPGAWIMVFARDVDRLHDELVRRKAIIKMPPTDMWSMDAVTT